MSSPSQKKPSQFRSLIAVIAFVCLGVTVLLTVVYSRHDIWSPASDSVSSGNGSRMGAPFGPGGFDLSQATIPTDEIYSGGPPKDGIPALTAPKMIEANDASYLSENDRVIGVTLGGDARAYPLKILNYHEVVNDSIGGQPLAITYCPLCDSAAVVDRRAGNEVREFGVSGLLYNSNVLMFDRNAKVESLWSQMMTEGVSGPAARQRLKTIPLDLTTWTEWRTRYPKTKVMSIDTGHDRDYQRSPYDSYFANPQDLMFPVDKTDSRLPTKTPVLGVWTDDTARAFPLSAFGKNDVTLEDELNGRHVSLVYNAKAKSLRIERADDGVQWVYSLWFAWYAFHPETEVSVGRRSEGKSPRSHDFLRGSSEGPS